MWQAVVRHRRLIVVTVAGLIVVLVVTTLVDLLGRRWVSAIQASTTLLLLLATATYAYLTWRLVRATEDPPSVRLASERAAVEAVTRATHSGGGLLRTLIKFFPLDTGAGLPSKELFSVNERIVEWTESLSAARVGLPLRLRVLADDVTVRAYAVAFSLAALHLAAHKERKQAEAEQRAEDWFKVRVLYDAEGLARSTADELPDWETLVGGAVVEDALEGVDRLSDATDSYLLGLEDM